ncbi:MAG TPA: hypothetical protein VIU33_08855 [Nitrospiria bacterium]
MSGREKMTRLEKINHIIRIILLVVSVGVLLVGTYAFLTRGSGY